VALEGRGCAAAIARFLADPDAGWDTRPAVPVRAELPLRWIVPTLIVAGAPPPRAFVARVSAFVGPGALEVRQGGHLLHRGRFRSLVPNRSLRLASHWVTHVRSDGGPVVVSAVTASEGAAP
jgi:hypothetical protein